jgi:hypothetical protein
LNNVLDGPSRDAVCTRVVELLNAAVSLSRLILHRDSELINSQLVAVSYGGNFDDEVYDGWKSGMSMSKIALASGQRFPIDSLSSGMGRRGSAVSALTTPSRILANVDVDVDDTRTLA